MTKQGKRQTGAVLISVLVLVALVASSVALMLKRQNINRADITFITHQANAIQYLFSLEAFAKQLLKTDLEDDKNLVDHLEEDWAQKFAFAIDNGQFEAQLSDLQAGLNINSLFEFSESGGQMAEKVTPDFFGCFNRLNLSLQSNANGDSIINYLNEYDLRKITHPSELKRIDYIQREDYQKISPFLYALKVDTTININTARDEILKCLHPNSDSDFAVGRIKSGRPYKKTDDVWEELEPIIGLYQEEDKKFVGIKSDYFVLKTNITIEQLTLNTISVLKRNTSKINVISRTYHIESY